MWAIFLSILVTEPIRALQQIRPGLYRAIGLCSAGLALSPGLRARAWTRSSCRKNQAIGKLGPRKYHSGSDFLPAQILALAFKPISDLDTISPLIFLALGLLG